MGNIEVLTSIKFKDEKGDENTFVKGENIIVALKNKGFHKGILTFIGQYSVDDSETFNVICVDTSKSKMSYSVEIIKLTDIEGLYKNESEQIRPDLMVEDDIPPFADILKYVSRAWKNSSKKERKEVIEMLAEMK